MFAFHAGPIIRQEKGYELMNRHFRGRIFDRMMNFARKVEFKYHCIDVDKRFVTSTLQIATKLKRGWLVRGKGGDDSDVLAVL